MTYISVVWEYLHVAHWEDPNGRIPLPLVPVVVHLFLHVDDVTFPEGQFPVVLCLGQNIKDLPLPPSLPPLLLTWKLKRAFATILQSSGFLPALRNTAWFPLLSSYLQRARMNLPPYMVVIMILTCSEELEISGWGGECRGASWTPGQHAAGSPCVGRCSGRTGSAAASVSS